MSHVWFSSIFSRVSSTTLTPPTEGAWCSQIHHHPVGYNIQVCGFYGPWEFQENMGNFDHDIATKYIKIQLHQIFKYIQIFYYVVYLLSSFLLQFCAILHSSGGVQRCSALFDCWNLKRCFAERISAVLAVAGVARCGVLRRATAVKKKGVRVVEGKDALMRQNSPSQIEPTRCMLDPLNHLFGN